MRRLEETNYHKTLRVSVVVVAFVLLFQSGIVIQSTSGLAYDTNQYLAQAVGMSASVSPTDLNTVTAELTKQKQLLDAREAALREREISVELNTGGSNERGTFIVAGILTILLLLIVLNYVLDFLRYKREVMGQISQTV